MVALSASKLSANFSIMGAGVVGSWSMGMDHSGMREPKARDTGVVGAVVPSHMRDCQESY